MKSRLAPVLTWTLGDAPLDARLMPLLRAVREHGALGPSAKAAGVSYRAAWDLLRDVSGTAGAPLVLLERGRGARLTDLGERLLAADDTLRRETAPALQRHVIQTGVHRASRPAVALRIAASHDFALARLAESGGLDPVELSFRGSLDSLEAWSRGDADVAGFHLPEGELEAAARAAALRWIRPQRDRLVLFAGREQGLIVTRGNPRRIGTLADLTRRGVRFVNRQRGSGTRLLLDAMLARDGIAAARITGHAHEEFTHAAVAATIASGHADAGFGLRAAAAQFNLGFVPLVNERYWFAVRASQAGKPQVRRLLDALKGEDCGRILDELPGYSRLGGGAVLSVTEAFGPGSGGR